jgi:hypothetical protein
MAQHSVHGGNHCQPELTRSRAGRIESIGGDLYLERPHGVQGASLLVAARLPGRRPASGSESSQRCAPRERSRPHVCSGWKVRVSRMARKFSKAKLRNKSTPECDLECEWDVVFIFGIFIIFIDLQVRNVESSATPRCFLL